MTDLLVDPGYGPYVYDPYVPESTVPDNIWSPGLDYNEGGNGEWTTSDPIYSPGYDYTTEETSESGE